ncbi:MAG: DNA cytosine methyltransferase [Phycisphaerae bacterium]|nr:DNA cytosine methyltransferase [Phycisphaerae bacterium]
MNSIELFAGAGGLALGTAKAGFCHRMVIDWDHNAAQTLRRNQRDRRKFVRHWEIIEGDVAAHDFRQYAPDVEFVCGGPPCQPFSLGGKHMGQNDTRNMFPQAVRAVREIAPKAFIFENVKGLLRRNFANYYSYIIHQLRYPTVTRRGDEDWTEHLARLERTHTSGRTPDLRYHVVYRLLNAADYGVPQRRERVLIVGIRSDLPIEFSFPAPTHEEDALLYAKWVSQDYWDRHRIPAAERPPLPSNLINRVRGLQALYPKMMLKPWRTVRDAIADLPPLNDGEESPDIANHYLNPGARAYAGHNGSPYDEPAKALKAGDHGVPGGENTLRFDDGTIRYFTVRECARLQTFPDDWTLEGSWTECMRQLGNAVPVTLAEVVAKQLATTILAGTLAAQGPRRPVTLSVGSSRSVRG